jgi:hypothetical protein
MIIASTSPTPCRGGSPLSTTARSLELIRSCGLGPNDPILAAGDVDGELLAALRQLGHTDITVLHPRLEALQRMREALGDLEDEVLLIETEVPAFQVRRRYALWHDSGFFQRLRYAEERHGYVQQLQFALRPEGHLIISTPGLEGPQSVQGIPVMRYSAQRLAAELGGQFELRAQALQQQTGAQGRTDQLLHCCFQRHAPAWTG